MEKQCLDWRVNILKATVLQLETETTKVGPVQDSIKFTQAQGYLESGEKPNQLPHRYNDTFFFTCKETLAKDKIKIQD